MNKPFDIRFFVLFLIITLMGTWRVLIATPELSNWTNFSPVGAMALFAGSYFINRSKALLTPILVLFISDIILMQTMFAEYRSGLLYEGWYWTYISFGLMVLVGEWLKKGTALRSVILGSLIATSLHFIISNFGVWLGGGIDLTTGKQYTRDWAGLLSCYTLAIPYFKNLLFSNLIFGTLLFGGFELAQMRFPVLRVQAGR